jgi:hypothetical protein
MSGDQISENMPSKRKYKVASYYRTAERDATGDALFEFRLYTAGKYDATLSVPSALLNAQVSALREQGYEITRLQS